ncbi:uncharacterized protein LOC110114927 [Dendrobium catenatum]|uniref:DUF599 domain-containing protein n=1 Tax=Dendrobium catenatum TaxID=906689 RepID=A0A2I0XE01_9ASPA|nr:uncharacterized protein LOC110114927 [Dendrobium catenatum]PKU86129.1 hypothetical protein MA16_Dca001960 [Dendrobium catenatum]
MVLDYILVFFGLLILASYHLWLLLYILHRPTKTVIGINAINRRLWVQIMMEDPIKNGVLAVQTLRNNIMASTLMASTSIMLCSLIAVLMTNYTNNENKGLARANYFSILLCFLVSFLLNIQSVRYYSHASILINVPPKCHGERGRASEYVASMVNRGSFCWSLGLRACYFSFPLFLWVLGAMATVASSLVMVVVLYFLDIYLDWGEQGEIV